MIVYKIFLITLLFSLSLFAQSNKEYLALSQSKNLDKPIVQKFIQEMSLNYGFDESYIKSVLSQARLDTKTLKRY